MTANPTKDPRPGGRAGWPGRVGRPPRGRVAGPGGPTGWPSWARRPPLGRLARPGGWAG